MNDKPETKIGYISPLKRICMTIGELPTSYLETMSYYEMLVWFVEFLKNQVIPVVNNNSEATQELQNLFTELQNYVNNYFDNLDVQEEINNKLDEMLEDGTLDEIINHELYSNLIPIKLIIPKNFVGNIQSGESCLLLVNDKKILFDTNRSDALGEVMSYLDRYNAKPLDYVILSHYHDDHVGNFVSLFENGYITENTQIFLPAYSNLIEESESTLAYYNSVNACITNNNLNARIPDLEEIIEIDDLKIQFFNCDTTLFGTMGVTNYNDCSTICLLQYGNQKTLMTGDAVNKPYMYFVNNKKMNFKIHNYQIEHHGYNMLREVIPFMQQINPDNAFVFTTKYSLINQDSCTRASSLSFMSIKGNNIINQGLNEEDCVIEIYKNYTSIIGKTINNQSSYAISNTVYVDSSINDTDYQIGTQMFPFKSLKQALSLINKVGYGYNVINLADGDYNFPYHIISDFANIIINGNSTDKTKVKILNRLSFYDCINVELNNLSIDCTDNVPLTFNNSNVKINNCNISSSSSHDGIVIDNSRVYLSNNTIDSCNNGIYATNSIIDMETNTFSNNNRGYRFNHIIYKSLNETFTNNATANYLVQNSSNITGSTHQLILFNGNEFLSNDEEINIDYDITKCMHVNFCFGRVSDGTWTCDTIYPYANTFAVNDTFSVKTLVSTVYFKIIATNKLQAININTTNQALRKIVGHIQ